MRFARPEEVKKAVGENLRLTRIALGLKQKDIVTAIGLEEDQRSTYQNWEAGERLIDPLYAVRLAEHFSLSLDWIYRGQAGTLSADFMRKLAEARAKPRRPKRIRKVKKSAEVVPIGRRTGSRPGQKQP